MTQNTTITVPPDAWTQLTSQNVVAIRLQNLAPYEIFVNATAGATPPAGLGGAVRFGAGHGDVLDLAAVFPGVPGAARVWAWSAQGGQVSVSHG